MQQNQFDNGRGQVYEEKNSGSKCKVKNVSQLQDEQIRKNYPHSEKKSVIDQLHRIPIEDPYRWLEDIESDAVSSWIKAQNKITDEVLNNFSERETIKNRLTQLQYRDEVLEVKQSRNGLFFLKKLANKEQK